MSDRRPANPPQVFTEDIPFSKQAKKNGLCIQCDDIKIEVTIEIYGYTDCWQVNQ